MCSDDSCLDPDWNCSESSDDECILPSTSEASSQQNKENETISLCTEETPVNQQERIIIISENNAPQITSSIIQHDEYKRLIWKNKSVELPEQQTWNSVLEPAHALCDS